MGLWLEYSYFYQYWSAVPFWGQTTWNLSALSPKRDCGSKRVKSWCWSSNPTCVKKLRLFESIFFKRNQPLRAPINSSVVRRNGAIRCGYDGRKGWSILAFNPFRTAVPFSGQTTQILSSLSPIETAVLKGLRCQDKKRSEEGEPGCGLRLVNREERRTEIINGMGKKIKIKWTVQWSMWNHIPVLSNART